MSSDITDTAASFCPACGNPVDQSQSINADDSVFPSGQGVYKNDDGNHVVVEGSIVSIYHHKGGDA